MTVAFLIRTSPLFCACATTASATMSAVNRIAECLFIVISLFSTASGSERRFLSRSLDGAALATARGTDLSWRARAAEIRFISHRCNRAANRVAVDRAFPGDGQFLVLNFSGEGEAQFIATERSAEREGSERRCDFSADRRAFLFDVECQLNRPLRRFRSDRPTACR